MELRQLTTEYEREAFSRCVEEARATRGLRFRETMRSQLGRAHLTFGSLYALFETIRATQWMGAISIYSGDPLHAEAKERLGADVKHRLFDLSRKNENANEEEVLRRALALADGLRFRKPQNQQEEVH